MEGQRILALGNPASYAEAQERVKAVSADAAEAEERLALLAEAQNARAFVDSETLGFVRPDGEPVKFVPYPPVVRYAGLLATPEVIGNGSVTMVANEDNMTAGQIQEFVAAQGDE